MVSAERAERREELREGMREAHSEPFPGGWAKQMPQTRFW